MYSPCSRGLKVGQVVRDMATVVFPVLTGVEG